ncbi:MAG TPA: hypothetical protein VLA88_02740 [Candidatus Saccharimonadales bacterium]|nr:hypothetical protein [Candidatus Saccharimonadales bacterium]
MVMFIGACMALGGVLVAPSAAMASTQTVGFRVGSWRCPSGVFGISRVVVTGTSSGPSINGDKTFPNTTQTAYLPINGVPAGGGAGNVTATYHCKVKVGIWTLPGPGEPANSQRWIYGSGTQPTYTL